ncbi:hypothetical protein BKA62DRAFT_386122 [Auriculariales sp. MPI-PUGE-AT-0066]|nr:hypothetical protein BKA62DRAFT_386122 [Auriculariales sp. MPI-PUGE-AT-0066]
MGHSSASGTAPTMRMPIPPQLDAIWEGFLAETSGQDTSLLDLCGALRTTSSLDSVLHSPSTRSNGAGTPTRSTSESLLPYLLRAPTPTPVSRKVFVSAGRSPSSLGDLRTSPSFIQRRATDTQIGLMTRIMSDFPLSPKTAPELPIPNELLYVPSRPAPQPPSASTRPSTSPSPLPKWEPLKPRPPLREQDTTPPKIGVFCGVVPYAWQPPLTTVPLRALPEPPRPGSRQRKSGCPATAESTTSSTTTVSSTYWEDDISDTFDTFDANSSRSSSSGWSGRTTSVSQHHSRSHSRIASPLLWPASPTSCEFFGPAVASRGKDSDFRWGYAV